jgi:hypothetical protein
MKFVRTTPITDAVLVSSSVPEDDAPVWSAPTAYAKGATVTRPGLHRIFERQFAGTSATPPESDSANWVDIGPTNRWAMYDRKVGTVTTAAESLTVVLAPGRINSLALLGVDASRVIVTLTAGGEVVYSATIDLVNGTRVGNWYDYFYEPFAQIEELVITDLVDAALLDMPAYGEGVLTVTLERPGGTVSCGLMAVGMLFIVGETEHGAKVSIRDYSQKTSDRFGNWDLEQGDYSKLMNLTVRVQSARVDEVSKTIARHRATNAVWIGSEGFGAMVIYGFLPEWDLVSKNAKFWTFSAQVEGMTS